MTNISEKAKDYVEGKAMNALTAAIENIYADGYNAGFADGQSSKEGEKPEDLDDGVEYVDLGLPSGTMWAKGYLTDKEGNIVYLPYIEAEKLKIPTKEQYEELRNYCILESKNDGNRNLLGFFILGRNGNTVYYERKNYFIVESEYYSSFPQFWLKSKSGENVNREVACISSTQMTNSYFMGYRFPIVLVRQIHYERNSN